jgi:hypothetical protein
LLFRTTAFITTRKSTKLSLNLNFHTELFCYDNKKERKNQEEENAKIKKKMNFKLVESRRSFSSSKWKFLLLIEKT